MRRADPQQMARWLTRRERQGWSWVELSRGSGYPTWKLRWWQKRFERSGGWPGTADAGFVAVEVAEPVRNASASIEITTPSGYCVRVPREFEAEHLRRVVEALERRC
jgi:hypothetical protein